MKNKDIIIDGDIILHLVINARSTQSSFDEDFEESNEDVSWGDEVEIDIEPYKERFRAIVEEWVTIAEVESICYGWTIGKTKVVISGKNNFRFNVYPEYKKDRKTPSKLMKKLKKWARTEYIDAKGCEADDVIAYYVRKGGLGFSFDKDLIYGVAGRWFDVYHSRRHWITTKTKEATHFFKCQILAGDRVDGIPSLNGVGLKTAEKLMEKYGSRYDDIVKIFIDKGYTKEYMVQMTRLVCMSQWSPKKGIKLWKLPR